MGAEFIDQISVLVLPADFTAGQTFTLQAGTTQGFKHGSGGGEATTARAADKMCFALGAVQKSSSSGAFESCLGFLRLGAMPVVGLDNALDDGETDDVLAQEVDEADTRHAGQDLHDLT